MNPNPMQNNRRNNHKIKRYTGSKSKNTIKKSEYVTKYIFPEQGVTFHLPYKNYVLAISIMGKMNTKRTRTEIIPVKI